MEVGQNSLWGHAERLQQPITNRGPATPERPRSGEQSPKRASQLGCDVQHLDIEPIRQIRRPNDSSKNRYIIDGGQNIGRRRAARRKNASGKLGGSLSPATKKRRQVEEREREEEKEMISEQERMERENYLQKHREAEGECEGGNERAKQEQEKRKTERGMEEKRKTEEKAKEEQQKKQDQRKKKEEQRRGGGKREWGAREEKKKRKSIVRSW